MPIYEYRCRTCQNEFEVLVRGDVSPVCPACEGTELDKLLSLPRVHSEGTHAKALRAAKKRDSIQARERMHTRLEIERNHDD